MLTSVRFDASREKGLLLHLVSGSDPMASHTHFIAWLSRSSGGLKPIAIRVEHVVWRNDSPVEVELVAIHGGGHGMPQPHLRNPRMLGPTASAVKNAPVTGHPHT